MKTDFRDRAHLSTVDGDRPADRPRAGKRQGLEADEQVTCWQCLKDEGVETSMIVEVIQSPRRSPQNKRTGGTKTGICAYCLSRGKVTKLIG